MSESLADLFASGIRNNSVKREKKQVQPPLTTNDSLDEKMSLAYPSVESLSDVIPPDDSNPTGS